MKKFFSGFFDNIGDKLCVGSICLTIIGFLTSLIVMAFMESFTASISVVGFIVVAYLLGHTIYRK